MHGARVDESGHDPGPAGLVECATASTGVAVVAEKIRGAIEALITLSGAERIQVTTSVGGAFLQPDDERPDEALVLADQALYQAKHQGRNRVVIYQGDQAPEDLRFVPVPKEPEKAH